MATPAVSTITIVQRDARIAKQKVIRAQKAVKIAGPKLLLSFENELFGVVRDYRHACKEFVRHLNSTIDNYSEEELCELAQALTKLTVTTAFLAGGIKNLPLRNKQKLKMTVDDMRYIFDRFVGLKESLDLSSTENFATQLTHAVQELRQAQLH
jgi:hypothetical protein